MERDDVVEAVARALSADREAFPEEIWMPEELTNFDDGHLYGKVDGHVDFTALAQAALSVARPLILEELREPTPEMIEAGGLDVSHIADDPLALARDIWQAMLATAIRALKDTTHDR